MSKIHLGLRRAGFAGAASALALGGALVAASSASAVVGTYASAGHPAVTPGTGQTAADLTYDFDGTFNTNSTVTFTIPSQACNNPTQIAKNTGFSAAPTVTVTDLTVAGTQAIPTANVTLGARTANCLTAGVKDQVTVTLPTAGAGTDDFRLTVSGIKYDVGATAVIGNINVVADPSGTLDAPVPSDTVSNAVVSTRAFGYTGFQTLQNPASNVKLGTAVFAGLRDDSYANGDVLTIKASGATFDNVQPTIVASTGYSVPTPVTFAGDTATLTLAKTGTPATPLTLTVTGLQVDVAAPTQVKVTSPDVTGAPSNKAINVLNFGARFGGSDRNATAAKLFAQFGPKDDVVLSDGRAFADALGADYLAQKYNTGLLLTEPASLPTSTRLAIINQNVKRVFITGGPAAVSPAVEAEIAALNVGGNAANPKVQDVRIAGADRYATNSEINRTVAGASNEPTVLMASGLDFPDALALGPVSYDQGLPLILSNGTSLSASNAAQLVDLGVTRVVIAGGTSSVSQAVENAILAKGIAVTRVAGANRFSTATAIAQWATEGIGTSGFLSTDLGFGSAAGVSTGFGFADALASGPFLGHAHAALLLTQSASDPSADTTSYLGAKHVVSGPTGITDLAAIGGTDVVSSALMTALAASVEN